MDVMNDVCVDNEYIDYFRKHLSEHIMMQQNFTNEIIERIKYDSDHHDESKTKNPEFMFYCKLNKALTLVKYESKEYKEIINDPHVAMHKESNSHHPEFYGDDGINGMTLVDIVNMLSDWKSASMTSDTPLIEGMKKNKEKFEISDQLYQILVNTVELLGW